MSRHRQQKKRQTLSKTSQSPPSSLTDVAVVQGRPHLRNIPVVPPPSAYTIFAQNLAKLTIRQQQQLMLFLYQTNFICREIVRLVVDPVVGKGIRVIGSDETPTIQEILLRYFSFNRLYKRKEQKKIVRSYINTGEVLFLTAPYLDTWFTVPCSSLLIRQTILDPANPDEVIGVVLEPGVYAGVPIFYRTVTDETRLSPQALQIRAQIPKTNYCYYFYNDELDLLVDTPTGEIPLPSQHGPFDFDSLARKQRRGTPFFNCWADLYNHLVEALWAMLDKAKSRGAWNYQFTVKTDEKDFDESVKKVKLWKDTIGTPTLNTAIFTDENVAINPVTFPMQSQDIQGVLDVMLQVTGQSANVPLYDLGSTKNTPYATAREQGSPKEQFQQSIQIDTEEMLLSQAEHIIRQAIQRGQIPKQELEAVRGIDHYGLTTTSPELKTVDNAKTVQTYQDGITTLTSILAHGLHQPKSIADAMTKLTEEALNVTIEAYSPEEIQAVHASEQNKELATASELARDQENPLDRKTVAA